MRLALCLILLTASTCYGQDTWIRWQTNADTVTHYVACFSNTSSMSRARGCATITNDSSLQPYHYAHLTTPKRNDLYYRIKACNSAGCSTWSEKVKDDRRYMRIKH